MTNNRLIKHRRIASRSKGRSRSGFKDLTPKTPNLGSLVFGVLVGIFVTSLLVFLFSPTDITLRFPTGSSQQTKPLQAQAAPEPTIEIKTAELPPAKEAAPEPRFDFYSELTKTNTTSQEVAQQTQSKEHDLKTATKSTYGYLVQAGNYRRIADADAMRAKLTLNGFRPKIESNKERNGEAWNKVIIGPVKNQQSAKEIQQKLKTLDIDSKLVQKPIEQRRG